MRYPEAEAKRAGDPVSGRETATTKAELPRCARVTFFGAKKVTKETLRSKANLPSEPWLGFFYEASCLVEKRRTSCPPPSGSTISPECEASLSLRCWNLAKVASLVSLSDSLSVLFDKVVPDTMLVVPQHVGNGALSISDVARIHDDFDEVAN